MHDLNSPGALMIPRDDYDGARSADPKNRHHFQDVFVNVFRYQYDNEHRGMVHNHPSGDPTPSRADITMTKNIVDAAAPLGITIHDHIIIGKDGHASLRGLQLM